jgi:eukaryotic-like serine/threonine-protein kinase
MRSGQTSVQQDVEASSPSSVSMMPAEQSGPQAFGRYVLHAPIARGGMATIYIARLIGAEGFSRIVAAKRLYPQFTEDPEFVTMFHDEARIASKIHHPNVVPVLDVVREGAEVVLVQEYVHGVPLDKLFSAALTFPERPIPIGIAVAIVAGVLAGLHAAHETRDEMDEPLHIVHRDVSPQNVIVSVEGIPRLLDFGIAKARSSAHITRDGFFKGKVAYMAPEQLRADTVTRTADVYACGVLLWELLVHRRLHTGRGEAQLFSAVLTGAIPLITNAVDDAPGTLSESRWHQLIALEPLVAQALANNPFDRFDSAAQMLEALLHTCQAASSREVAEWVRTFGAEYLARRQQVLSSHAESWRSQSKMSAVPSAHSAPDSGVKLRRAAVFEPSEPSTVELSRVDFIDENAHQGPSPAPAQLLVQSPAEDDARARRIPPMPWLVAGGLLLIVGILLGLLVARTNAPEAAAPTSPPPGRSALFKSPAAKAPEVPAATGSAAVASAAVAPLASSPPTKPSVSTSVPRSPSPRASAAQPAQPDRVAPSTVAATPPAASSPPPKADCNPPFYFEGTKKLYKAGCL